MTVEEIINKLELVPLSIEGGMYRSTYVSKSRNGEKPAGTAIYYLLTENSFSHMHRLPTDEVYHFYFGDPVELLELLPEGGSRVTILGNDILNGQKPQYAVMADGWQGSHLVQGGKFALLGTTMAPGYVPADYEHGDRESLCREYPEAEDLIRKLTGEVVEA